MRKAHPNHPMWVQILRVKPHPSSSYVGWFSWLITIFWERFSGLTVKRLNHQSVYQKAILRLLVGAVVFMFVQTSIAVTVQTSEFTTKKCNMRELRTKKRLMKHELEWAWSVTEIVWTCPVGCTTCFFSTLLQLLLAIAASKGTNSFRYIEYFGKPNVFFKQRSMHSIRITLYSLLTTYIPLFFGSFLVYCWA